MNTLVCYSILAVLIVLLILYAKTVSSLRRSVLDLYEVASWFRATVNLVFFPWRVVTMMREDLKLKNRAMEIARRLGIDVDDLLKLAAEQEEGEIQ